MYEIDIPDERLRVFISSAQSNEGEFSWSEVRRRIKDYLKECPYLNPFIMEDVASPTQSEQHYQRQLRRADIVVLLVKGEVRTGTATEYALATKYKKPMLVYFLNDGSIKELSAISLQKNIEDNDYCTYCSMPTFDDIEKVVRKDIIESVICYFQDVSSHSKPMRASTETVSLPSETQEIKHSVPTKTAISLFNSCYNHIFDLLDIPQIKGEEVSELSPLHDIGVAALDWLITGQNNFSDTSILKLIDSVSDLYPSTEWLSRRWDAIRHELVGDIDDALTAESHALSLAKAAKMPLWIVTDVLIDCRNIENEIWNRDRTPYFKSKSQKEINELNTIVYLPVLDRYLGNIYGSLTKETDKYKMASPETVFLGTNIGKIINDVENYFFTAMLYGSYTHMLIARDLLVKVLYQYNDLTDDETLLFDCTKLWVLCGNAKIFKRNIDHKWDDMYLTVTSSADELWHIADKASLSSKDSMKLAVLTKLGLYMTDSCFAEAVAYLKAFSDCVYWGVSEDFFDCIYQNINRLDTVITTEILTDIIREQRFHLGGKLSDILMHLNIGNVPYETQITLCNALKEKVEFIVSNGGHPQFIAALVMQNKEIFEVLASVPNNGLHGTERIFYDLNTGYGDWNKVITDQIDTARQQFEINKTPGEYHSFFERPYATIKSAVHSHYVAEMASIINENLIPLCVEVLDSQVPADVKNDCIDCLCDIFIYSNPGDIVLTQELVDTIKKIDISKTRSIMGNSKNILVCRMLMLRIITGIADHEELLEWCFDFSKKDNSTKVALAGCVDQYLRHYRDDLMKIDAMILSIVLQCFEDKYWQVRRIACNCLAKMLTTRYKGRVELKLYEGAIDPSHYVRNHLLRMCKNGEITDISISERITAILKNDANYAIRAFANS